LSTVSFNYTNFEGSGIYNDTSGTVTVENSSSITRDVYNFDVLYLPVALLGRIAENLTSNVRSVPIARHTRDRIAGVRARSGGA
jgi:hypothetical protein